MPIGPRPPMPNTFGRVTVTGTWQGHRWAQVFYVALTGSGILQADIASLATAIRNAYNTNLPSLVLSSWLLNSVQVVYLDSGGNEIVGEDTSGSVGTGTGTDVADAAASYVIKWPISAYYRGGHPRTYMTGVTINAVTNGSDIVSARRTALNTAWTAIRTAVNAFTSTHVTTCVMGTLSFARDNEWRVTPLFFAYGIPSCGTKLGSQRRRIRS